MARRDGRESGHMFSLQSAGIGMDRADNGLFAVNLPSKRPLCCPTMMVTDRVQVVTSALPPPGTSFRAAGNDATSLRQRPCTEGYILALSVGHCLYIYDWMYHLTLFGLI
ncbi:hypothetical protein J6590_073044 [Homalodisca vitripennis]|nr:hypothetical protein J6590_073044 [Homalodisca vitripennis]